MPRQDRFCRIRSFCVCPVGSGSRPVNLRVRMRQRPFPTACVSSRSNNVDCAIRALVARTLSIGKT